MKNIAIIGTVGIPAKYGGFETLVEYLTLYLGSEFDITVYCSSKSYEQQEVEYNNVKLEYIALKANGIQSILYDIVSILKALQTSDTLLVLGVSGCIVLPILRMFSNKKFVINIDGLEWKRDKWNKIAKGFLKYSERMAVKYADEIVTDNKAIENYVMREYGRKSNLIAYGADHINCVEVSLALQEKYPVLNSNYAFTVCRIEPENNLHMILEGFSMISYPIIIIGNWSNSEYGRLLKIKYQNFDSVYLLDPIYDQSLLNQFRANCTIYIHGHSAGGTNPSLVEAMYLSLPVFAYGVDYNIETTRGCAKYFLTSKEMIDLIENTSKESLQAIADDLKRIANRNYTWKKVAEEYAKLF